MKWFNELEGRTIAAFLARTLVGLLFFMAGWWKVFSLGVTAHAQNFFIDGFKDHWIPDWLLWPLGVAIPPFELLAGFMLLIGWRSKEFLTLSGLLLLLTTYGHALQQPLFDIDGHTFTRMILIIIVLVIPAGADKLGIDGYLASRKAD